jgi:hypothetical protein
MPLTPGTRLGTYEVIAPLGAGGMTACGRRAGGAPRNLLKQTDLAHAGTHQWG